MEELSVKVICGRVEIKGMGDHHLVGPEDQHEHHHYAWIKDGRVLCGPNELDRTEWIVSRYKAEDRFRLGYVCQKALEKAAYILTEASDDLGSVLINDNKDKVFPEAKR